MENEPRKFGFSVLDLLILTAYVALLFALPFDALGPVVVVSAAVAFTLGSVVHPFFPHKRMQSGTVNMFIQRNTYRLFIFFTATTLLGAIALALKWAM